jgi:hypothetical protein
MVAY